MRYIWLCLLIFSLNITLLADETYTVRRGDNLLKIANEYGITVNELKELNRLRSDHISVGQKLIVRRNTNQKPIHHTVRAGDTLSSIARRYDTTVSKLVEYNDLKSSNIKVNERLVVGYERQTSESRPQTSESRPQTSESRPQTVEATPTYHIVESGETLSSISRRYGVDVMDLVDFNKLSGFLIVPGQRIYLVDGQTEESAKDDPLEVFHPTQPKTHTVKTGENLYRIALRYDVSVDDIRRWNRLTSTNISVGQVLYLQEQTSSDRTQPPPRSSNNVVMPISRINVLSEFGMRNGRLHKGIDFGGNRGDPIYSVLDGVVAFSGVQRGYGNVVIIEHDDFIMTVYGHNEANLVRVGERVTAGQTIARVGNTGNANGYHIHFEYRVRGTARNPRELLKF